MKYVIIIIVEVEEVNIVDLCIVIVLIFGCLIGWKNGFVKQLVSTLGLVLVFILAFYFKRPISSLFYRWLPFIDFGGIFKGVEVINIIIYEFFSFLVAFCLFMIIFKIALKLSNIVEKLLKVTVILAPPFKILGAIVGLISSFIVTFIVVFFLNLPIFDLDLVNNSKFANVALYKTTGLSNLCNNTILLYEEINNVKEEYKTNEDKTLLNNKILNLLLEYNYISRDDVDYLISNGKLKNITLEN